MEYENIRCCLAALYLRGLDRSATPPSRGWPLVVSALRRAPTLRPVDALAQQGLSLEAHVLADVGLWARAEETLRLGQVLTAEDDEFPEGWLRLGASAPPALWLKGCLQKGPFLGIVGSRNVSVDHLGFAADCAREAVRLGFTVLSGGAMGCDRAAIRGAGRQFVELIAAGFESWPLTAGGTTLSLMPPQAPFLASAAMERNALLYSACEATLVVHARLKTGGAWCGAVEALRRRRCRVLVRDCSEPGNRALISLGGVPLGFPSQIGQGLTAPMIQASLPELAEAR